MQNIIKTIYDNSKNGRPSFNIKTEDGRTMYANEYVSQIHIHSSFEMWYFNVNF